VLPGPAHSELTCKPGHAQSGVSSSLLSTGDIMKRNLRWALALIGLTLAGHAAAQVTFYERADYQGRSFTTTGPIENFERFGFNDRASSVVVQGRRSDRWEVCEDRRFRGRCVVLRPGQYPSLTAMDLDNRISSVRVMDRNGRDDERRDAPPPVVIVPAPVPMPASGQIRFYENDAFQGRSFTADGSVDDFRRIGFNDRASSVVVTGERWEVCQGAGFAGPCVVLRPGQYASLNAMGMNDRISSVRSMGNGDRIDERRYAPMPMISRDYGRRQDERLFEANVSSVRAVLEDSGRRCWVEPQQVVVQERGNNNANVPGALLGAVIGGILGHQVGGGTGKDVATGVGVVAGAAIGGNASRGDGGQQVVTTQNVQRCSNNPDQVRPAYWDVSYIFRGQEHRVQMNRAPGQTITVNDQGEPRG
jgi:uncharacterized protein YcfJ